VLRAYKRHYPPGTQKDSNYRRCHCPKWINGMLPTGEFLRASAKTRSSETAERKARFMEINAESGMEALRDISTCAPRYPDIRMLHCNGRMMSCQEYAIYMGLLVHMMGVEIVDGSLSSNAAR
jgi:hypothetical protein